MNEKLQKKLDELGYNLTDENDGIRFFSKITSVGAPSDNEGNRVYVFVEVKPDGTCSIATDAFSRFGHVVIDYKELDGEFFARNLKTLERQVVYAWRELAD